MLQSHDLLESFDEYKKQKELLEKASSALSEKMKQYCAERYIGKVLADEDFPTTFLCYGVFEITGISNIIFYENSKESYFTVEFEGFYAHVEKDFGKFAYKRYDAGHMTVIVSLTGEINNKNVYFRRDLCDELGLTDNDKDGNIIIIGSTVYLPYSDDPKKVWTITGKNHFNLFDIIDEAGHRYTGHGTDFLSTTFSNI